MSFVSYESVDYTYVINRALLRVSEKRAELDGSMIWKMRGSTLKYLNAVESLMVILLPSLRPRDYKDKIFLAKRKISEKSFEEAVEILDLLVEDVLESLNRNKLLMRGESIRVTR